MTSDITYLKLKRAIEKNTECFLCALEDEIERKYIDTYLSELVMDASSRQKIIESRGFCNHHFYKMLIAASKPQSFDGHGMALVMKSITEKLILDMQKKSYHKDYFQEGITNEPKCPTCIHLVDFMEMYVKSAVKLLSSNHEEFLKLFRESKGLCVPHFATLMHMTKETARDQNQHISEIITEVEEKSIHTLDSELAEYVRRQSYEFSDNDRKAVEDTVLRSVEKIAGRRGIRLFLLQKLQGVLRK